MENESYNNESYREMLGIIMGDAFYSTDTSYDARIAQMRRYGEIILRRLLGYSVSKKIEIGKGKDESGKKGYTEQFFENAIECIRVHGNNRMHTQEIMVATKEEYDEVVNAVFDLLGYLFYKYFEKYPFGENQKVLTAFSLLPPIIRNITLELLFQNNQVNRYVVEKLAKAKLKAYDKETADLWIEENKSVLDSLDMYERVKNDVEVLSLTLSCVGRMYKSFEEAKKYYENNMPDLGNEPNALEFIDLMEFVYMGRKSIE